MLRRSCFGSIFCSAGLLAILNAVWLGGVLDRKVFAQGVASGLNAPEAPPVLLQMVRDDSIHQELGLSEQQVSEVLEALGPIDGPWFRVRIRPVEERVATIAQLTDQLTRSLEAILDSTQMKRLEQLHNQALGTRMIVRDRTAERLGLSDAVRERLYKVFRETDSQVAALQKKLQAREVDAAESARETAAIQAEERKKFTAALDNEQKRMLSTLTGESFNFGGVKRMYPFAPELTTDGAQWLQGSGAELADLRGKVVALHFYAFQCINCKRNLPHYNGWHTDYADDGLVVIGIQTPETATERKSERVAQAMRADGIEYPVLMDGQSKNWAAWSNTMWPTVYLIDKKGFLRRWWQGEMNWKGTPGEQQMRETIEMLLSEEG